MYLHLCHRPRWYDVEWQVPARNGTAGEGTRQYRQTGMGMRGWPPAACLKGRGVLQFIFLIATPHSSCSGEAAQRSSAAGQQAYGSGRRVAAASGAFLLGVTNRGGRRGRKRRAR